MSATNEDLLQQISKYAGAIDRHERESRERSWHLRRGGPYARSRSAKTRAASTRNRSLVLDGSKGAKDLSVDGHQWISSRDRGHMTLTNPAAYDVTTATKLARINDTREAKRKARLMKREAKEAERLKLLASTTLVHEGATYRFNRKASLLVRVDLENAQRNPTPLQTLINGVEFLKSPKTDNLFRKTTIKLQVKRTSSKKSSKKYCKYYTRTGIDSHASSDLMPTDFAGICTNAKDCPYVHDSHHRALCSHFLTNHGCDESRVCNLSHDPLPENTPTCTHHLTNSCTKLDCRYSHSSVSVSAPICPEFARNGWCARGHTCSMRHLRECPLFSNKGACKLKHCKLPHIARANHGTTMVKAATTTELDHSSEESASESDSGTDEYASEAFDERAFGDFVKL